MRCIMSQESILNIVLSAIVALTAIFALFQTHRQIKLSNKQFLFNRRLDKYLLAKSLIELYKDNINNYLNKLILKINIKNIY